VAGAHRLGIAGSRAGLPGTTPVVSGDQGAAPTRDAVTPVCGHLRDAGDAEPMVGVDKVDPLQTRGGVSLLRPVAAAHARGVQQVGPDGPSVEGVDGVDADERL
jgi:hypothetical protein